MARATDITDRVLDGRYELVTLIGEGTFGRVYRGRDLRLERDVAVKVIKPWWAEDPVWLERFAREARTLARVNHDGIVQIYDVGQSDDSPYYVAELMEGGSLADRLAQGPLAPDEAADIALQLSRALAHAHREHVVHRDVKPANILLGAQGRVKIGDFGVARLADGSSHGAAATAVGTPRYMSPEQARGEGVTAASDVYGVGVVLYEMLSGRPPFTGNSAVEVAVRHLNDPPPPMPDSVPPQLAAVVDRALAKEPGDRYPDGAAMADALAAIPSAVLRASPVAPAPPPSKDAATNVLPTAMTNVAATNVVDRGAAATRVAPPPAPPPRKQRAGAVRRRRIIAVLALVVLLIGLVALLTGGSAKTQVPELRGLQRAAAVRRAHNHHLKITLASRYSDAATKGVVIGQEPASGEKVDNDTRVRAIVSAGPRPVKVPQVVGDDVADAQNALAKAGLHSRVTTQPAAGKTPGTVLSQSPSTQAPPGSTIALTVVAQPRWRTVTSFASTGDGAGKSVPFRIRGDRWRLSYDMHYVGSCSFLLVCFGPGADVIKPSSGEKLDSFDLGDGSGKTHEVDSGPGIFQVKVSAGRDSATWSIRIQDYY
jgi:eukaryotic-like serine/threonine-protein kinase